MLKPSKMTKIRLIISRNFYNEVLSVLHDLGVMQIDVTGEEAMRFIKGGEGASYKEISDMAQRFRGLDSLLYPMHSSEMFTFETMDQLFAKCNSIRIDERVSEIKRELDAISAQLRECEAELALLAKLKGFDADLGVLHSKGIKSFVATGKELKPMADAVKREVKDSFVIPLGASAAISISKDLEKDFAGIAERYKVQLEVIPEKIRGKSAALTESTEKRISNLNSRRKSHEDELRVISEKWYPLVSAIREQLDIEMEKQEITNRIGIGKDIMIMEGWAQHSDIPKIKAAAEKVSGGHYLLEHISTKELPPTRLDNPARTRFFEFFIRFYSLPRSDEVDPTMIFVIVFPIFFGFMVGDFGYGLVMLLGSLWLIHRLNHPVKKSRLPKMLTRFVTMIVGPSGLMTIAKAIIPGAVIAMVLGVVFNEYMGFQLPYTAPFNVLLGLPKLLVIAGYMGVFMVEFGFLLGFYNKIMHHERKHAIAKLGWFSAALGVVIFGLTILHKAPLGTSNPLAIASYAMLIGGVGTVLYGEGFGSLMELPSIVSHILSYVRLVGILLTSVILASIIDLIFLHGISHSIVLAIVGVVILVVGQIFNMVIALFESGIQGARLIYVEFFSKFFMGNGVPFRPFKSSRKRTLSKFKLE